MTSAELNELANLLDTAERPLSLSGQWKAEFNGFQLWAGDPSGSRNNRFEGNIRYGNRGCDIHAKIFKALKKKFIQTIQDWNNPITE